MSSIDSARKRNRYYKDNIQSLKKNQFRRLGYVAGIKEMSSVCYEELRGIVKVKLEEIISKLSLYLEYNRSSTVNEYMIAGTIYPHIWSENISTKKCKIKPKSKKNTIEENIKYYQKNSSRCLTFGTLPFKRLIKEIFRDFISRAVRLSENASVLLQYFIEDYIVEILILANKLTLHSNKERVEPKEIAMARKMFD